MHRAYILCQTQSGLSVSDLLKLVYADIKSQIEKNKEYIHLRLLRGKRKELGYHDTLLRKH